MHLSIITASAMALVASAGPFVEATLIQRGHHHHRNQTQHTKTAMTVTTIDPSGFGTVYTSSKAANTTREFATPTTVIVSTSIGEHYNKGGDHC